MVAQSVRLNQVGAGVFTYLKREMPKLRYEPVTSFDSYGPVLAKAVAAELLPPLPFLSDDDRLAAQIVGEVVPTPEEVALSKKDWFDNFNASFNMLVRDHRFTHSSDKTFTMRCAMKWRHNVKSLAAILRPSIGDLHVLGRVASPFI